MRGVESQSKVYETSSNTPRYCSTSYSRQFIFSQYILKWGVARRYQYILRYRVKVLVMPRKHQLMVSGKRVLSFDCRVCENERIAGFSFEEGTNFWLITNTSIENTGKTSATALCALVPKERTDTYTMILGEMVNKADKIGDNYSDILTYFERRTINVI